MTRPGPEDFGERLAWLRVELAPGNPRERRLDRWLATATVLGLVAMGAFLWAVAWLRGAA